METLLEGVEAIRQPCTVALTAPAIAIVLAARTRAVPAAIGYLVGASVLAWAQAARLWEVRDVPPATTVAGLVAAGTALVVVRPAWLTTDIASSASVVVGAIAGWLWRPCVGPKLADVLNNADSEGTRTLGLMTVYVAGVTLPALMLASAPLAWPRLESYREAVATRTIGLVGLLGWSGLIFAGVYDDVLAELLSRSRVT